MVAATPDAARPGTAFYSPDVRISRLGVLREEGEAGENLVSERSDLISVEVTRVNTGASHYAIVLNNWNDTLTSRRDGQRRTWPPFKYNDFRLFEFGMRLRIDVRYSPDPALQLSKALRAEHGWVPMIAGPITDMKFSFSSAGGARLTLTGEDDLYPLKNKSEKKVTFKEKTEKFIIVNVLRLAGYPLDLHQPEVAWPPFFTDDSKGLSENILDGQSYLEFLQKIAKRFDCEVFVEFDDLASRAPAVEFHFEPARSRQSPNGNPQRVYIIERGKNLIEFSPTIRVLDQYTGVAVKGHHRVRSRPTRVTQRAEPKVLSDELHRDVSRGDPKLVSGPEVRKRYFKKYFGARFEDNTHTLANQTNFDEERAKEMAEAVLRQKARAFMTITGTTVGLPDLRPGVYVEIRDMRDPFDGFFYVEKTVTRYGSGGFTTQFTARRPGMPLPPYGAQ